jgi:hypothetical protein
MISLTKGALLGPLRAKSPSTMLPRFHVGPGGETRLELTLSLPASLHGLKTEREADDEHRDGDRG